MKRIIYSIALLAIVTAGCHHDHSPGEEPEQDLSHGTAEIQDNPSFTVYSESLELFVETGPFAVGQALDLNAHFTDLRDGHQPVSGAAITLSHVNAGQILAEEPGKMRVPGIYRFNIASLASLEGDLLFIVEYGELKDSLRISHFHGDHDADHAHGATTSGEITFTKEQAWKARFRVEAVARRLFSEVITASGEMLAMPGEKQSIIARTNGMVLFSSHNLVQGSPVNQGKLLFSISGKGLAEDNVAVKFNEAKTRYQLSRQTYERQRTLYAEKVVSERQFRESENRYINDSVAYYSLAGTVSSEGMNVYSPMTGYLHELNVTEGQYVETGQKMATLSANRIMLLRADLSQQHFSRLGDIATTTFRPAYSEKVYTLEELNGRLLAKGASVAENNHYIPVYFEVTNDGSLLEGAYAEFFLKTEDRADGIVIPASALIEEQNNFYVYVQVEGESYTKRYVTTGPTDGNSVLVQQGLSVGERIVTVGAMLVKTASISSAPSHGHQH